jgi:cytochrome c-type biogenesis protein CcsB
LPVVHAATSLEEIPPVQVPDGVPAWLGGEAAPVVAEETRGSWAGVLAIALTVLAWACHLGSVVTRGLAAHRVPWGNMYEFSSVVTLGASTTFLVLLARPRTRPLVRPLGAFVMLPIVLTLGLGATVLYSKAEPLQPALQDYWIKIHVVAAIIAWGTFMVGAVATGGYLVRSRYEKKLAAASPSERLALSSRGLARHLAPAENLDRLAYRVNAFAFPIWTFAIVAGAIWAERAWGRYWGWDPKETWSFITWVVYAGYLHARATAGWKGHRAAALALLGFSCLTIDYYVVNIFVVGLHSYAGL